MSFQHKTQVGGDHYNQGDRPQHWDLATMYQWDPFQYQITKYVMRWKDKHPTPEKKLEDLKKCRSFLDKYIAEYEAWLPKTPTFIPAMVANHMKMYELAAPTYISDNDFLCEGGWGDMINLYTCRHCSSKVLASGLQGALQEHGNCPGRGYVAQG